MTATTAPRRSTKQPSRDWPPRCAASSSAPATPSYDEARKVYNAMIDKRPALIARCADVADVIAAVNFAREHDLLVAIRGGGHNGPGLGTCRRRAGHRPLADEGVRVDPVARTARVEGGALLGDLDHATQPSGWPRRAASSPPPASAASPSAAGSATSPATSAWPSTTCSRPTWCWPTAASSRPARRSTPISSGRCAAAAATSASSPPSSSGCTRSATVYAGPMLWPLERAAEVLRWYRDFITAGAGRAQRLLRLPDRAAGARPSRRSCGTRRCAASSGATPGR